MITDKTCGAGDEDAHLNVKLDGKIDNRRLVFQPDDYEFDPGLAS